MSDQIERLLGAWREGLLPSVTAIGSTWMESGERTLFVGVDSRLDPRPSEWAPGNGAVDRVTRALIRRYGPLPPPRPAEEVPVTSGRGGAQVLDRPRARSRDALMLLASLRLSRSRREAVDLVTVPLFRADEQTRAQLMRYEVHPDTRVGYVGPIRPLAKKGRAIFRHTTRQQATAGCIVEADGGRFLTTAGHLGAQRKEAIDERLRRQWRELGKVAAATSPDQPDDTSSRADGIDIAAVAPDDADLGRAWAQLEIGDPRNLRKRDYISWNGSETGRHEGWLAITAAAAKGMTEAGDPPEYEHALMVIGNPPRGGGREGDSGTAIYDRDGRLLGHLVGTDGAVGKGTAQAVWFQMIDVASEYLEEQCGTIRGYYGDGGA